MSDHPYSEYCACEACCDQALQSLWLMMDERVQRPLMRRWAQAMADAPTADPAAPVDLQADLE